MSERRSDVKVWDLFVRLGHWFLVAAFITAYLTEGEPEDVHVVAGYSVAAYVVSRVIWGFVGSQHARFSDFVRGPRAVVAYLVDLAKGRPPHHLGHNPAGGAMIVALLVGLTATVSVGLVVLADAENEGPLAAWFGHPESMPLEKSSKVAPVDAGEHDEDEDEDEEESVYAELHESLANITLALVLLHVLGVIASSLMHRENLVRAMFTGRKPVGVEPRAGSGVEAARKP